MLPLTKLPLWLDAVNELEIIMKNSITVSCPDNTKKRFQNDRKYERMCVDAEIFEVVKNFGDEPGFDMHELPDDGFIVEKNFGDEKLRVIEDKRKITVIHIVSDNDTAVLTVNWSDFEVLLYCWATDLITELANRICDVLDCDHFAKI